MLAFTDGKGCGGLVYRVLIELGSAKGSFEAPPSRFASLTALTVVGATGGRVRASRGLVTIFHRVYARLGYQAGTAGDTLAVEPERPTRPVRTRITLPCDPVLLAFVSLMAGLATPLGSRIVLGVDCDWMVEHDLTPILEAAANLGIRMWKTGNPSTILVVEPTAVHGQAYRSFVRLVGLVPGYVAAALLTALVWRGERSTLMVSGQLEASSRVSVAIETLKTLGAIVESDGRVYVVEPPGSPIEARAPGGYAESLAILSAMEATVEGLPERAGGEEELLAVHRSLGLEHRVECSKGLCRISRIAVEPRSATLTASANPETVTVAMAAIPALRPRSLVLGGLKPLEREGVQPARLERMLSKLNAEAVTEEDRLIVLGWREDVEEEGVGEVKLSCEAGLERQCLAMALGAAAMHRKVSVTVSRDPDEAMPGVLRALEQLGAKVRVLRG